MVGSKDNNIFSAYGGDILNDNEALLLSFTDNHELALVNTLLAHPRAACRMLSMGE